MTHPIVRRGRRPWTEVPGATLVLAAALVGVVPFVEAGKPLPEVPLVLTFGKFIDGFQIDSDGQQAPAPYDQADYADRMQNVRAYLFPSGNLTFTTLVETAGPATRRVCFGLGSPPDESFPVNGCWPLTHQIMTSIFTDTNFADNVNIQTLTPSSPAELRLQRMDWETDGGLKYSLGYGTNMDQTDEPDVPDSPGVLVKCIAMTSGKCSTWTVASQAPHRAALFVQQQGPPGRNGKPTLVKVHVGDYVMPFLQTVTVK